MFEQLKLKLQSAFSGWFSWVFVAIFVCCVVLFFVGMYELPQLLFGRPPSSIAGLWAVVATVVVAGKVAEQLALDQAGLRLKNYGESPPLHQPSIGVAFAVGLLVLLLTWRGTLGDFAFPLAVASGLVAGLLVFLTVGRVWSASSHADWSRKNAHAHKLSSFVIEGRTGTNSPWTVVCRVDDSFSLQELLLQAHARFKEVRYWRSESYVTLMHSDAVEHLLLASPVAASAVPEKEARQSLRG